MDLRSLFDWGMMRLRRPIFGIGDAFSSMETDDPSKKKREAERLEEEKNRIETRKQRYDGVQAWQRARRAEKLRFQALKADDQEAYMKMVEEGKKERLAMLLGKTNDLLVQCEKDADIEQPNMLQIEGMMMLSLYNNNLNGILADEEEMGLGRTIQTIISLIAYLMENKGVNGSHLIVAPKAVLPNWVNEFTTRAPSISALVYDGRVDERKALREEYSGEGKKFNVLITHYDLIIRDKAFLRKIHWHYLVVDERDRHRLKNDDCILPRTLVSGYRIRRRLLLTGSPIQNSLQELWSLLNFLLPNIFDSVDNFEDWFNAPFPDKCHVSLTDEEQLLVIQRLHHVITPFILRRSSRKDEVEKYLPSKTQVDH